MQCFRFTAQEATAQRGTATCPRSFHWLAADLGFERRPSGSRVNVSPQFILLLEPQKTHKMLSFKSTC